jgi:putative ABC transport system permease protein
MSWLRMIAARLGGFFRSKRSEEELDAELRAHIDALAQKNIARGMSAKEARYAARREFGGLEQTKEEYREQRSLPFLETLLQDVRYGLRMLAKTPALSAVIVVILALGIGCGTALYSLIDACLFHTAEQTYPTVQRWEAVRAYLPGQKRFVNYLSVPEIRKVKELAELFEDVGAIHGDSFTLGYGEFPERILGTHVTANAITMTQVKPILGRTFREDEDRPGGAAVVVLSYELWQRKFSGDRSICGQVIRLNSNPYTIIGVMPPHYGLWGGELWMPLQLNWADSNRADRQNWIIAVLREGVSEQQANALLQTLSKQLEQQYGTTLPEYRDWNLSAWNIEDLVLGGVKPAFYVLAGAVALLLLVVCANVAILLLARATSRMREIALRAVLGASRGRILRQMLTESLLLSFAGGVFGIAIAKACLPLLVHLIPHVWLTTEPDLIQVNRAALAVACGIAGVTGILFGLAPALQVGRQNFAETIREGGAKVSGERGAHSMRSILVVAEIALSMVVLAGAALMAQSYRRLENIDVGFRPEHVLSFQLGLPDTKYAGASQIASFFDRTVRAIEALPGAESAGVASGRPLGDRTSDLLSRDFTIEGRTAGDARGPENAIFRIVSPGYFGSMGVRLVQGRTFSEQDGANAPRTAIINEAMARQYWPAGDAIGQRIRLGVRYGRPEAFSNLPPDDTLATIVGVVSDVKQIRQIDAPVRAELYVPLDQQTNPPRIMNAVVKSRLEPAVLTAAIRGAIATIDAEQPIYDVDTMDQLVADSFGPKRLTLFLLLFLAAVVLVLASVGLYATLAYSVSQRRKEIGIRMAVGAQAGDIRRLVVSQGTLLALGGVAVGLAGSLALTRLMQALLYNVSASDPLTLLSVAMTLVGVALLASYVPARGAMSVDPMSALRSE